MGKDEQEGNIENELTKINNKDSPKERQIIKWQVYTSKEVSGRARRLIRWSCIAPTARMFKCLSISLDLYYYIKRKTPFGLTFNFLKYNLITKLGI